MKEKIREILVRHSDNKNANDRIEAELLILSNISARNWAKMREDACRVREQVAINFMLEVYCDVEVTEELQNEAYEDFKKRYVR